MAAVTNISRYTCVPTSCITLVCIHTSVMQDVGMAVSIVIYRNEVQYDY